MSASNRNPLGTIELGDDGVAVFTMRMEGAPVNRINADFLAGLTAALDWLEGREGLRGLILASGHRDWCAGADLDMVMGEDDPAAMLEAVRVLGEGLRRLETLGVPVVAAITGAALGGGCELALGCHRRVALDAPHVRIGLPEVSLGLIPGGGGTQRLPRLIGLQPALEIILQGKVLRARKALSVGLVDELAPNPDAVMAAARAWIAGGPDPRQPWDRPGWRWPEPDPESEMGRNVIMASAAMLYRKTAGSLPAPEEALAVVQEGARLRFEGALRLEQRAFARLAVSPGAKDMIRTLWFHRSAAEKLEDVPRLGPDEDPGFRRVAILGAGMMGAGLAFVCARGGYEVVVKDIDAAALERARAHFEAQLGRRARDLDEAGRAELLGRVRYTLDASDLAGADLVIEAVVEKKAVKHAVTREVEPLLAEDAVWASNTSALPITELAEASAHPDRFVGLHFFSPVEVMPLLEVVRGERTADRTVARVLAFGRRIRKTPIVVNDGYGFFTSRVFASYLVEGAQLVVEGHHPALVEWAARSAGMAVPPLQVFDEVTLRLGLHVLDEARDYTGRVLPGATELVRRLVEEHGRPGRAAGAGFYDYEGPGGRRKAIWPGLAEVAAAVRSGEPAPPAPVEAVARRLLLAQAVEAARAVDEGVIVRPRDADVGAVFGLGFAPGTGGPLAWLDRQGIAEVVAELEGMARDLGSRFEPPAVLRRMAAAGERFYPR